jgi:hypothetical protein
VTLCLNTNNGERLYKLSESRFTGFKDFEDKSLILGERGLTSDTSEMRAVPAINSNQYIYFS